jgi:hypothetical protein
MLMVHIKDRCEYHDGEAYIFLGKAEGKTFSEVC